MSNSENTTVASNSVIEQLQWRYATKKMDASKVVAQEKIDLIIEAARLAPTSSGLQPFEVIAVYNPAIAKSRAVL